MFAAQNKDGHLLVQRPPHSAHPFPIGLYFPASERKAMARRFQALMPAMAQAAGRISCELWFDCLRP